MRTKRKKRTRLTVPGQRSWSSNRPLRANMFPSSTRREAPRELDNHQPINYVAQHVSDSATQSKQHSIDDEDVIERAELAAKRAEELEVTTRLVLVSRRLEDAETTMRLIEEAL